MLNPAFGLEQDKGEDEKNEDEERSNVVVNPISTSSTNTNRIPTRNGKANVIRNPVFASSNSLHSTFKTSGSHKTLGSHKSKENTREEMIKMQRIQNSIRSFNLKEQQSRNSIHNRSTYTKPIPKWVKTSMDKLASKFKGMRSKEFNSKGMNRTGITIEKERIKRVNRVKGMREDKSKVRTVRRDRIDRFDRKDLNNRKNVLLKRGPSKQSRFNKTISWNRSSISTSALKHSISHVVQMLTKTKEEEDVDMSPNYGDGISGSIPLRTSYRIILFTIFTFLWIFLISFGHVYTAIAASIPILILCTTHLFSSPNRIIGASSSWLTILDNHDLSIPNSVYDETVENDQELRKYKKKRRRCCFKCCSIVENSLNDKQDILWSSDTKYTIRISPSTLKYMLWGGIWTALWIAVGPTVLATPNEENSTMDSFFGSWRTDSTHLEGLNSLRGECLLNTIPRNLSDMSISSTYWNIRHEDLNNVATSIRESRDYIVFRMMPLHALYSFIIFIVSAIAISYKQYTRSEAQHMISINRNRLMGSNQVYTDKDGKRQSLINYVWNLERGASLHVGRKVYGAFPCSYSLCKRGNMGGCMKDPTRRHKSLCHTGCCHPVRVRGISKRHTMFLFASMFLSSVSVLFNWDTLRCTLMSIDSIHHQIDLSLQWFPQLATTLTLQILACIPNWYYACVCMQHVLWLENENVFWALKLREPDMDLTDVYSYNMWWTVRKYFMKWIIPVHKKQNINFLNIVLSSSIILSVVLLSIMFITPSFLNLLWKSTPLQIVIVMYIYSTCCAFMLMNAMERTEKAFRNHIELLKDVAYKVRIQQRNASTDVEKLERESMNADIRDGISVLKEENMNHSRILSIPISPSIKMGIRTLLFMNMLMFIVLEMLNWIKV